MILTHKLNLHSWRLLYRDCGTHYETIFALHDNALMHGGSTGNHHITHHSSLITHHSSLITHHSSLITHHLSLIIHHSSQIIIAFHPVGQTRSDVLVKQFWNKEDAANLASLPQPTLIKLITLLPNIELDQVCSNISNE